MTTSCRPRHQVSGRFLVSIVTLFGATAAIGQRAESAASATSTTSATKAVAVEIPKTLAGERLNDVLAIARAETVSDPRYKELFSAEFRTHVPRSDFRQVMQSALGASVRLEKILQSTPTALTAVAAGVGGWVKIDLAVDAQKKIGGLFLSPYSDAPPPSVPTRWADIDRRLSALAPMNAMVAAKIDSGGKCSVVHGVRETTTGPLGSMFKLYVLAAIADAVAVRRFSWDDKITVRDEWKSLPSGTLQNEPAGTKRSVTEMANAMISMSDNTATDHLLRTVGRNAVEKTMVATGIAKPERNLPFMTTRQLFVLKGTNYPRRASQYRTSSRDAKRSLLDGEIAKVRLTDVMPWASPREVDTVEWFASPMDICRVYAYLDASTKRPSGSGISKALSINDGGLALDPSSWSSVWFKGGSEPGVLTLGYLAKSATGDRVAVVMLISNTTRAFDERAAAEELIALVRGSFELAAPR